MSSDSKPCSNKPMYLKELRAELIWSKDPDVTLTRLRKSLDPNLFWRGSIAFFDDSSMSFVHTDAKFELRYHSCYISTFITQNLIWLPNFSQTPFCFSSKQKKFYLTTRFFSKADLFFVKPQEFLFWHYILTEFSFCGLKCLVNKRGKIMLKKFVKTLWLIK